MSSRRKKDGRGGSLLLRFGILLLSSSIGCGGSASTQLVVFAPLQTKMPEVASMLEEYFPSRIEREHVHQVAEEVHLQQQQLLLGCNSCLSRHTPRLAVGCHQHWPRRHSRYSLARPLPPAVLPSNVVHPSTEARQSGHFAASILLARSTTSLKQCV